MSNKQKVVSIDHVSLILATSDPFNAPTRALTSLNQFIEQNEDPENSMNYANEKPDNLSELFNVLRDNRAFKPSSVHLIERVLHCLLLLTRKESNRLSFVTAHIQILLSFLKPKECPITILSQTVNVLLNICYEEVNVSQFLATGGLPILLSCLSVDNIPLKANIVGTLQSICYQDTGKAAILKTDGVKMIISLFDIDDERILTRTSGALHNISADAQSVPLIIKYHAIPKLVHLLDYPSLPIQLTAAGTLQNILCDKEGKAAVLHEDIVPPLLKLLCNKDPNIISSALGALLNVFRDRWTLNPASSGREQSDDEQADKSEGESEEVDKNEDEETSSNHLVHPAMKKLLTLCLTLSTAYHLFTPEDSVEDTEIPFSFLEKPDLLSDDLPS